MTDEALLDLMRELKAKLVAVEAELQRRLPGVPPLQWSIDSTHSIQEEVDALTTEVAARVGIFPPPLD